MNTAGELERLHFEYDRLKTKKSEIKGGLTIVLDQLKDYDITTIEGANKYIKKKGKEKKTKKIELKSILKQISRLLKK